MRSDLAALGLGALALLAAAPPPAVAATLTAHVVDDDGEPLADAVVVATAPGGGARAAAPGRAVMDQVDKTYVPHVLPVVVGTAVQFPNRDDIRHHVYSFSETKRFELPLYKGTPADPVVFDRPGVVVLGCNIHDFMRGYVYVAASPHFAVSDEAGEAAIEGLAPGVWEVAVWHPRLAGEPPPPLRVELAADGAAVDLRLELKSGMKIRRAPTARRRNY